MTKKVVVIGELNADLIFTGADIRPECNREKLVEDFRLALGSSSAIFAAGLAGLGREVEFVSIVGDDDIGRFCLSELAKFGVGTSCVKIDPSRRTGVTLSLSDGRDRALLTYLGTIDAVTPELIPESIFENAAHVHFGSFYLQRGMRKHWRSLFQKAKRLGLTTSFDVGWDPEEDWDRETVKALLEVTDWFLPNEEEALRLFSVSSVYELPERLPDRRGYVIIKRGSRGAMAIDPDGSVTEQGPFPVQPVDTTGAGDSFNAGWVSAMLEGRSVTEALKYANACGALSTTAVGGAGSLSLGRLKSFWPEGFQNKPV